MKNLLLSTILLCLSACTSTYPVRGVVEKTNERFLGTTTVSLADKDGTINIVTDKDVSCTGSYPISLSTSVSARGAFTCDDGRSGTFAFSGTSTAGKGFGKFNNGGKFLFTYGSENPEADAANAAALAEGLRSVGNSLKPQPIAIPTYPAVQPYRGPIHCTTTNSGFNSPILNTSCY